MSKITTLKDAPEYEKETLLLIHNSLGYQLPNNFNVDFYPLFNKDNFDNCHILIEDNKVIGHIGYLPQTLQLDKDYLINMYGGIVVHEDYRGKGHFSSFFEQVMLIHKNATFSLLWSDKLSLYEKFGYYPCVNLLQYHKAPNESEKKIEIKRFDELSSVEFDKIKELYKNPSELRVQRSAKHWETLKHIRSCEVHLIKSGKEVENYFIRNKGQDLQDIIHEYGLINEEYLKIMMNYGHVWTPYVSPAEHKCQQLYGSIAKIESQNNFKSFLQEYSNCKINEIKNEELTITIKKEEFTLSIRDFLPGLFGPNQFKEIKTTNPLMISGLDSI